MGPRAPATLHGDVDGDGTDDRVTIIGRKLQPDACRYKLVVRTAHGSEQRALWVTLPSNAPAVDGLADIDHHPGLEIVVDVDHGASTAFVGVFTIRGGAITRFAIGDPHNFGAEHGPSFPYAGSVAYSSSVDCSPGAASGVVCRPPTVPWTSNTGPLFGASIALVVLDSFRSAPEPSGRLSSPSNSHSGSPRW